MIMLYFHENNADVKYIETRTDGFGRTTSVEMCKNHPNVPINRCDICYPYEKTNGVVDFFIPFNNE